MVDRKPVVVVVVGLRSGLDSREDAEAQSAVVGGYF